MIGDDSPQTKRFLQFNRREKVNKIFPRRLRLCKNVRKKGLEPPRLAAPDPKSGAATNYATSAFRIFKSRQR